MNSIEAELENSSIRFFLSFIVPAEQEQSSRVVVVAQLLERSWSLLKHEDHSSNPVIYIQ